MAETFIETWALGTLFSVWRKDCGFPANWEICRFFTLEANTLNIPLTCVQFQNLCSFSSSLCTASVTR